LKKHYVSHETVRKFSCSICGNLFKTAQSLKGHVNFQHTEKVRNLQCSECPKNFYDKRILNLHVRFVHRKDRPYSCGLCTKGFCTKTDRDRHIRRHLGERHLKCSLCDYKTTNVSNLNVHLEVHARNPTYSCTKCSFVYPTNLALLRHYLKVHVGSDQNYLQCFFCGINKRNIEATETHCRIHTKEQPYFCEKCPKEFAEESNLKKHVLCCHHNGSRPPARQAKCDMCGVWVTMRSLNRHIRRRHLRGEMFSCTKCAFKYPTELEMWRHYLKDHAGSEEDILECLFCEKQFNTLLKLEDHIGGHVGEQIYFCSICPNEYRQQFGLTKHAAAVHN